MDLDVPRAHHDLGGVSRYACQKIDIEPHELTVFDRQVDAIRQLLSAKGLMNVDELRRGIESMPRDEYEQAAYYERWLFSIETILTEKGVLAAGELDRRAAE